ncbi:MAG: hypothetical protein ACQETL_11465 [Bacteroidota bacterium]
MEDELILRNRIKERIEKASKIQLEEIDSFLSKLNSGKSLVDKYSPLAGSWKDMDEEDFKMFANISENRRS